MNDKSIKYWLGYALRNKDMIFSLLANFRAEDLENGILAIPEELINRQLSPVIMSKASPWVRKYQINFSNNMIFLDCEVNAKQAGPVRAMVMLSVEEFTFRPGDHKLRFQYREDCRSLGNPAQAVMLNMFRGKDGVLARALAIKPVAGVFADGQALSVDLDQLLSQMAPQALSVPLQNVSLRYIASGEGCLKLGFEFV